MKNENTSLPHTANDGNAVLVAVNSLTTNHKVQLENGDWVKIRAIDKGIYFNSKLLTYANGLWSCLLNTDKVEAIYCH
jgi:hypothetical protein